jgi:hypothetical protein
MNIIFHLKQPFPKAENKWRNIILVSLFVTLFLSVFQPFGIERIGERNNKYIFIVGFGLVTLISLVINLIIIERLFSRFFKEKDWCLYKELFWLFFNVFSIGLGNMFYISLFFNNHYEISFANVLSYQLGTFAVASFPITFYTITKHNYLFKNHAASATYLNDSLKTESKHDQLNKSICLYSYNKMKKVEFDINDLYFIESKGNDIDVYFYEDNLITSKTLRNTLKKSLEYLADSADIVQCHRAYVVNLNKINNVEGNSQGLVLKLANCDIEVPVSRGFVDAIKMRLV